MEREVPLLDIIGVSLICILVPPLAVSLRRGCPCCDSDEADEKRDKRSVWISLGLTLCCWLPGVIHAFYINFFAEGNNIFITVGLTKEEKAKARAKARELELRNRPEVNAALEATLRKEWYDKPVES